MTALDFSGDGRELAVASASGRVHVLDVQDGEVCHDLAAHRHGALAVAFHPREPLLATAGQDGVARLWSIGADAESIDLAGDAAWVEHLAWSPGGEALVTTSGRFARLWRPSGAQIARIGPHASTISGLAWGRNRDCFAVACYGGVSIWSGRTGKPLRRLEWKASMISVAWSSTSNYLACGCQDGSVHLWWLTTGDDLEMGGYPLKVEPLAFDARGEWLATGGGVDVAVWDLRGDGPAGRTPALLRAHRAPVRALSFARTLLVSGASDGLLCLWRPERDDRLLAFAVHDAGLTRLAWHPNGTCLAAGDADGGVSLWDVPPRLGADGAAAGSPTRRASRTDRTA